MLALVHLAWWHACCLKVSSMHMLILSWHITCCCASAAKGLMQPPYHLPSTPASRVASTSAHAAACKPHTRSMHQVPLISSVLLLQGVPGLQGVL